MFTSTLRGISGLIRRPLCAAPVPGLKGGSNISGKPLKTNRQECPPQRWRNRTPCGMKPRQSRNRAASNRLIRSGNEFDQMIVFLFKTPRSAAFMRTVLRGISGLIRRPLCAAPVPGLKGGSNISGKPLKTNRQECPPQRWRNRTPCGMKPGQSRNRAASNRLIRSGNEFDRIRPVRPRF